MLEYKIDVTHIEELQTIKSIDELDVIFTRAERMVIGGGTVVLVRKQSSGKAEKFDQFTTESDLAAYKERVYKYL